MNEISVGIVACASMHKQIKECVASLKGSFKIYPLVPPCTFNLKIDLMRYYLDRSIIENDVTILAYGLCHPQILALLAEYGDRVVRLRGSNCFEMFLGTEKYAEYHQKCYWMLNKPFFTRYKKELLAGFGAGTNNGKMLIGDTYKKLVYLRFDNDQLDIDLVEDFASTFGLEYEIHSADTVNLKRLLEEALASASPAARVKSLASSKKYIEKSEIRTVLENIPEVIYKIDVHTKRFTFISPQVERIFGYTWAEFTDIMNDEVMVPFYHEDDREQVIAGRYNFIVKCLNVGMQELYEVEYRVKHKRGNVLWVRESVYPNYSSEGIIESFVGKIADITERKCVELEREDLLKTIETAREAMNITSPDGIMIYTNPAMNDLFGYERGELIGKSPLILNAGPEPVAVMKDIMRAIEKQGIWEGEIHNKKKDGTEFISYARISAVKDKKGEIINFVSTQHDITERKHMDELLKKAYKRVLQEQEAVLNLTEDLKNEIEERKRAEEALKQLTEELESTVEERTKELKKERNYTRHLIESSPDFQLTVDKEGKILDVNEAFEKIVGKSRTNIIGEFIFNLFPEKVCEKMITEISKKEKVRNITLPVEIAERGTFILNFSGTVFTTQEGEEGVYITGRDITELRTKEMELIHAGRLASLGELATGVAHEINQPLSIISIAAEGRLRDIEKNRLDLKTLPQHLEDIQKNVKRIDSIITHMRTFTRKAEEWRHEEPEEVLNNAFTLLGAQFRVHDISVSRRMDERLPTIKVDANQLEQVFVNILTNARQVLDERGEEAEKEGWSFEKRLICGISCEKIEGKDYILFEFADNAYGVPDEIKTRVFEPFFTTKELGEGTGLGLSIAYGIVTRSLSGKIWVEDNDMGGASFMVAVPVKNHEINTEERKR